MLTTKNDHVKGLSWVGILAESDSGETYIFLGNTPGIEIEMVGMRNTDPLPTQHHTVSELRALGYHGLWLLLDEAQVSQCKNDSLPLEWLLAGASSPLGSSARFPASCSPFLASSCGELTTPKIDECPAGCHDQGHAEQTSHSTVHGRRRNRDRQRITAS